MSTSLERAARATTKRAGGGMTKGALGSKARRVEAPKAASELERLTARLLDLLARSEGRDVAARVQMGELLEKVRRKTAQGQWVQWLEQRVPFTLRSAQLLMNLSAWARSNPTRYGQLAPLGVSKLMVLSRLRATDLTALLRKKRHRVPDSGAMLTLAEMSHQQFLAVVAALSQPLGRPEEEAFARYQRRLSALLEATRELRKHRHAVSDYEARAMHAALVGAADLLADTFGLSRRS